MALKVEQIVNFFGCITNRYHVTLGRAKRICRTNGWKLEYKEAIGGYDVFRVKDGEFLGHHFINKSRGSGILYIILEGKGNEHRCK